MENNFDIEDLFTTSKNIKDTDTESLKDIEIEIFKKLCFYTQETEKQGSAFIEFIADEYSGLLILVRDELLTRNINSQSFPYKKEDPNLFR